MLAVPLWRKQNGSSLLTFDVPPDMELGASLSPDGRYITVSGQGQNAQGETRTFSRTVYLPSEIEDPSHIEMEVDADSQELTIKIPQSLVEKQQEQARTVCIKKSEKDK